MKDLDTEFINLSKMFAFKIMTHTIDIEDHLTDIICMSLDKKRSHIGSFLEYFDKVGLERKIDLVRLILKSNYPEILQKYPDIFGSIGQIKKWRNDLAHLNRYFETNHLDNKESFVLLDRKTSTEEKLSEEKMKKIMLMAEKCSFDVLKIEILIAKELGFKIQGNVPTDNKSNHVP